MNAPASVWTRSAATVLAVIYAACSSADGSAEDPNSATIGVLLPFTGNAGAVGPNLEKAVLLATEQINEAGGVRDHALALKVKDSGADFNRVKDAAAELISQPNLVGLIGPDQAAAAINLRNLVTAADAVCLLPSTFSPDISSLYFAPRYLLLAPGVTPLTRAVYDKLKFDGVSNPVILNDLDTNHIKMGRDLVYTSEVDGVSFSEAITVHPDSNAYTDIVSEIRRRSPDALVLFTHPVTAATLTNELVASGYFASKRLRWYLGPLLRNEPFLVNVIPGALEGAVGVSVGCGGGGGEAFRSQFASRWEGEEPMQGASYYYDAVVLLALGLEAWAVVNGSSHPSGDELYEHIRRVANPPGTKVQWNEVDSALSLVRQGVDIDYQGTCASLDFSSQGIAGVPSIEYWRIQNSRFVAM